MPTEFAGNDYLGLAGDPRLAETLAQAARQYGVSPRGSRWTVGWTTLHEQLETDLAEFLGREAACLTASGYLAGLACLAALAPEQPAVFADEGCHASLREGARAAGLAVHFYRHGDPDDLARLLARGTRGPRLIVTDALFGISGEVAPLAELRAVARDCGAGLVLDDAHGLFALGPHGRGTLELCGLAPGEEILLGSLSKALGGSGGFLAGERAVVERFRHAPAVAAATPLPAPLAAAALAAVRIVRAEPQRRVALAVHADRMRHAADAAGIEVVSRQTQIVALRMEDAAQAQRLSGHLLAHALRAPWFAYPGEPRRNLLRTVARCCYCPRELDRFAAALACFDRG